MSNAEERDERIVELESVVAHLQHDFEQLNSVVVRQQAEINELKQMIGKVEGELDKLAEGPERRNPLEERPPHY